MTKEEWLAYDYQEKVKALEDERSKWELKKQQEQERMDIRDRLQDEREERLNQREYEQQELIALGRRAKASEMLENGSRMHGRSTPWDFSFDE